MLNKLNTKKKLLLFPTMYMLIMILVGMIYSYYSDISNARNEAAIKTELFIEQVLKGRISAYQFLRSPNETTLEKVKEDFSLLKKDVIDLKNTLSLESNKILADEIIVNIEKYIMFFDTFSGKRILEFRNGQKDESTEVKNVISEMVKVGLTLESKLDEINKSAINLKNQSNEFLNNLLNFRT